MDIPNIEQSAPDVMSAVIEIPENSVVKYEMCEKTGLLKVSRIMQTPVVYPANYGFFPGTLGNDGDPLDCIVVCNAPLLPCCLIQVRPVGVLMVQDQSGGDEKVVCVPVEKIYQYYKDVKNVSDLPYGMKSKIEYFFQHYKDLQPGAWSKVSGWGDVSKAKKCINDSVARYKTQKTR